ncbi:MAG TPA: tetratricopeptide repeat protein, partial [Firmicutes bacterium]|nr:tetratricopeptide repeat protein [Bacillota bacterium]
LKDHHKNPEMTFSEFINQMSEKRNFQYILTGVIVLLLVITVFFFFRNRSAKKEDLAWFKTGQIIKNYYKPTKSSMMFADPNQTFEYASDVDKYKDCIINFREIMPSLEKTTAEPVALFYLGKSYFNIEEYKDAHETFDLLYSKHPKHFLAPLAILNDGFTLENSKNYDDAINRFKFVYDIFPDNIAAPYALLHMSFCYEALGDFENAYSILDKIEKYEGYEINELAQDRKRYLDIHKELILKQQPVSEQVQPEEDLPEPPDDTDGE